MWQLDTAGGKAFAFTWCQCHDPRANTWHHKWALEHRPRNSVWALPVVSQEQKQIGLAVIMRSWHLSMCALNLDGWVSDYSLLIFWLTALNFEPVPPTFILPHTQKRFCEVLIPHKYGIDDLISNHSFREYCVGICSVQLYFKSTESTRGLSMAGLVWNTAGRNEIIDVIIFAILALVFTIGCLLNSLLPSVDFILAVYISDWRSCLLSMYNFFL